MRKALFFVLLCSVANAAAPSKGVPDSLAVRAVAWDPAWKPASEKAWLERLVSEVASAVKDGADVIVLPEGFSQDRPLDDALTLVKDAAGEGRMIVLGNAPGRGLNAGDVVSRSYILLGSSWQAMDKLDPTASERARKPPVMPGMRLPLFRFRGAVVAVLPANSILKPDIASSLKKRGVQLVLVTAPADDERGTARVSRAASARAVELGAAVLVATPASRPPELYLPAQKGFDLKPQTPAGRDFRIPWKALLDLRAKPDATEDRPFLDSTPYYQIEL